MLRARSYLAAVAIAAVASLPHAARAQDKIDLTGKWQLSVQTDAGTGTPTVTLKQTGDSLSGHYSSQLLGESELKGTIKGGKFSFSFHADVQGTALVVTYTGTADSKDAIKGSVDLGGQASGTFTGARQKP